ncbi:MAG TPA: DUF1801 domain-containing protein [Saprospiraceae bacterium]|nr:DUF1801 domain-containing protein [Saprospiraceae bacterium]
MAKTSKPNMEEQVTTFYHTNDHPLKDVVASLRKVILDGSTEIGEQIKWNSPAFYFTGEMRDFDPKEYKRDIVVMNLYKKDSVLLVFPTGARIKDDTGLLEGDFSDGRKVAKFRSVSEVQSKEDALKSVLTKWLELVERI